MTQSDFDRLDIVSPVLALALREARVKWEPKVGDCCYLLSHPNRPWLIFYTRAAGGSEIKLVSLDGDSIAVVSKGQFLDRFAWLPRRRDCEWMLEEMGYTLRQYLGQTETLVRAWSEELPDSEPAIVQIRPDYHIMVDGDTPADAVAQALLEAKRRQAG